MSFLNVFWTSWNDKRCMSRSAALAFYTVFSLAPILVIVLAAASVVLNGEVVRVQLIDEVRRLMGERGADLVDALLTNARNAPAGRYAIAAAVILAFTATTAFAELKDSLDEIFGIERPVTTSWWGLLRTRLLSLGLVLTLAFVLLVSLAANAAVRGLMTYVAPSIGVDGAMFLDVASESVALLLALALFASIFRLLPDRRIPWVAVWVASLFTTILLIAGRHGVGYYVAHSDVTDVFGAAASLALVMLWVYYASIALLTGAVVAASLPGVFKAPGNPPAATAILR